MDPYSPSSTAPPLYCNPASYAVRGLANACTHGNPGVKFPVPRLPAHKSATPPINEGAGLLHAPLRGPAVTRTGPRRPDRRDTQRISEPIQNARHHVPRVARISQQYQTFAKCRIRNPVQFGAPILIGQSTAHLARQRPRLKRGPLPIHSIREREHVNRG